MSQCYQWKRIPAPVLPTKHLKKKSIKTLNRVSMLTMNNTLNVPNLNRKKEGSPLSNSWLEIFRQRRMTTLAYFFLQKNRLNQVANSSLNLKNQKWSKDEFLFRSHQLKTLNNCKINALNLSKKLLENINATKDNLLESKISAKKWN